MLMGVRRCLLSRQEVKRDSFSGEFPHRNHCSCLMFGSTGFLSAFSAAFFFPTFLFSDKGLA